MSSSKYGNALWSSIAGLIIVTGCVAQLSRIASLGGRNDSTPFFSANDRSRWSTIAALVEEHTYEIDSIIAIKDKNKVAAWNTIDKVWHVGKDGKNHYYSSKPPLLTTLFAGVYQALHTFTGAKLTEDPFFVARWILVIVNAIPLGLFWWWCSRWCRDEIRGLWARTAMLLFMVWGTFMTSFANTLSNHLSGALAVGLSLLAWRCLEKNGRFHGGWTFLAGLASALAVTCDLPALSWLVALGGVLLVRFGLWVIPAYSLGIAPIAIGFVLTNFLAHGEWIPAYAHRGPGEQITVLAKDDRSDRPNVKELIRALEEAGRPVEGVAQLKPLGRMEGFELCNADQSIRYSIVERDGGWALCAWGDWYDYPGSYWVQNKPKGVDRGEASYAIYAFHVFLGHHGIFSLTPFWFIGLIGAIVLTRSKQSSDRWMIAAIGAVTAVCLAFYLLRPEIDRNYGGVSCCFRWSVWMTPLWFWPTMQGLNALRKYPFGRRGIELTLGVSAFSALYAWTNPWVHPWLFQWLEYSEWISY